MGLSILNIKTVSNNDLSGSLFWVLGGLGDRLGRPLKMVHVPIFAVKSHYHGIWVDSGCRVVELTVFGVFQTFPWTLDQYMKFM